MKALCATLTLATLAAAGPAPASELLAVRAGTIHTAEDGIVLRGEPVMIISNGEILQIDNDLDIPLGAEVIDFGPDSVIIPGLVAADTGLATGSASARTASPSLRALDNFDFYAEFPTFLAGGITSAYVAPASDRLIAGQGAVVKLAGEEAASRVLASPAAVHAAVSVEARSTRAFWEPPAPATVDVGMGAPRQQLPKSTMGAVVALEEIVEIGRSGEDTEVYGEGVARSMGSLLEARVPWRVTARDEDELRAMIALRERTNLPIFLHGADEAANLVSELKSAGVKVLFDANFTPNRIGRDRGKSRDSHWPDFSTPAALVAAGVPVSISSRSLGSNLLFAAALASRGGLDPEQALWAITLGPAEAYRIDDRVGSLSVGKDADFAVLNGDPLDAGTSVVATWVDGASAWSRDQGEGQAMGMGATVLEVEELHLGDGRVLSPGQILMRDGRIAEVGSAVGRPGGARVIRGFAAMPGMIDAMGHLGLEGARKTPSTDFALGRIVGPGDSVDRRVARAGVTTVALTPRGANKSGSPVTAYKPAARDHDRQVIGDPVALHVSWEDKNAYEVGQDVRALLEKAVAYRNDWEEYEKKLAEWKPEPAEDEAEEEEKDEDAEESEKDDDSKKKKKSKKDEDDEPEVITPTGLWEGEVVRPPATRPSALRMRLLETDGQIEGYVRCAALSEELVELEGYLDEKLVSVTGLGTQGYIHIEAELDEDTLEGSLFAGSDELELKLERTNADYPVARRSEPKPPEPEAKAPRGKPKEPKLDAKLEPLRRALDGEGVVVVDVEREDHIRECVAAFREVGIRPVLLGARKLHLVLDEVRDDIAGVLPGPVIVASESSRGMKQRNRYAELQAAGVRVAFNSLAEEGAVDLPLMAAYAVSQGMSPSGALRALTSDAAALLGIDERVGVLEPGRDADVLLLDGSPLDVRSAVQRVWVNGREVKP